VRKSDFSRLDIAGNLFTSIRIQDGDLLMINILRRWKRFLFEWVCLQTIYLSIWFANRRSILYWCRIQVWKNMWIICI